MSMASVWPDPAERPSLVQVQTAQEPVVVIKREALLEMRAGGQAPVTAPASPRPNRPALQNPAAYLFSELSFLLPTLTDEEIDHLFRLGKGLTRYHERHAGNAFEVAVFMPLGDHPPVESLIIFFLQPGLLDELTRNAWAILAGVSTLALAVASMLALLVARSVAVPLQEMARVARLAAQGDLSQRVPGSPPGELGAVVTILNQALDQMTER